MATNSAWAGISVRSSVLTFRTTTAVTWPASSPFTSSTTESSTNSILSFARARSVMICDARNIIAPVHERHFGRELGEEGRLLHRRVAAAHDDDFALLEERRVADRAVRDAAALELALGLEPELPGVRPGRDDDGLRAVLVVADPYAERALGEVDPGDVVGYELGPEALRLLAELLHHLRAEHALRVAGIVLDVARDHQLAAPVEALDHERVHVRARRVEGGRVAGAGAPDDDHLAHVVYVHRFLSLDWLSKP